MISIIGRPEFVVSLSIEQLNILLALGLNHFDPVCRAACMHNGFLRTAKEKLIFDSDMELEQSAIMMTWMQADACLRILELASELAQSQHKIIATLNIELREAFIASNQIATAWCATYSCETGLQNPARQV